MRTVKSGSVLCVHVNEKDAARKCGSGGILFVYRLIQFIFTYDFIKLHRV